MKTKLIFLLALATGIIIGVILTPEKKMSPQFEKLLTLQFGHTDVEKISDEDADLMIDGLRQYAQMLTEYSPMSIFQVYAICGTKGLTDKTPEQFEKDAIQWFLNEYRGGEITDEYKVFADRVYNILTSSNSVIDITKFEP